MAEAGGQCGDGRGKRRLIKAIRPSAGDEGGGRARMPPLWQAGPFAKDGSGQAAADGAPCVPSAAANGACSKRSPPLIAPNCTPLRADGGLSTQRMALCRIPLSLPGASHRGAGQPPAPSVGLAAGGGCRSGGGAASLHRAISPYTSLSGRAAPSDCSMSSSSMHSSMHSSTHSSTNNSSTNSLAHSLASPSTLGGAPFALGSASLGRGHHPRSNSFPSSSASFVPRASLLSSAAAAAARSAEEPRLAPLLAASAERDPIASPFGLDEGRIYKGLPPHQSHMIVSHNRTRQDGPPGRTAEGCTLLPMNTIQSMHGSSREALLPPIREEAAQHSPHASTRAARGMSLPYGAVGRYVGGGAGLPPHRRPPPYDGSVRTPPSAIDRQVATSLEALIAAAAEAPEASECDGEEEQRLQGLAKQTKYAAAGRRFSQSSLSVYAASYESRGEARVQQEDVARRRRRNSTGQHHALSAALEAAAAAAGDEEQGGGGARRRRARSIQAGEAGSILCESPLAGSEEGGPDRMYMCPEENCTKAFPSRSRLQRHIVVHTGIKPFECLHATCARTFGRRDNMLQHYRTHSNSGARSPPALAMRGRPPVMGLAALEEQQGDADGQVILASDGDDDRGGHYSSSPNSDASALHALGRSS